MEIIYTCCCGLDVHKRTAVACLRGPAGKEVKTFGTMTADWRQKLGLDWRLFSL